MLVSLQMALFVLGVLAVPAGLCVMGYLTFSQIRSKRRPGVEVFAVRAPLRPFRHIAIVLLVGWAFCALWAFSIEHFWLAFGGGISYYLLSVCIMLFVTSDSHADRILTEPETKRLYRLYLPTPAVVVSLVLGAVGIILAAITKDPLAYGVMFVGAVAGASLGYFVRARESHQITRSSRATSPTE